MVGGDRVPGAVKQEKDSIMHDATAADEDEDDEDEDMELKPGRAARPVLDYGQYYPTVLPMRPPGHEAHSSGNIDLGADAAAGLDNLPVRPFRHAQCAQQQTIIIVPITPQSQQNL